MNNCLLRFTLFVPLSLASFQGVAQNGIYADFTTSMGSFTCRLDYAIAPKAVANFIGLATGERAWIDLTTGQVQTNAFYDGLTFHRVIKNFMIQGGSPNGKGNDGPGYVFEDEFSSDARFNAFGKLAMANSGPDSNGSQFFITTTNKATWLNDVHTIFGQVVGGSNVVYAIGFVSTDSSDKPLTNVVVQKVGIRRVGSAALGFNIHAQGLPVATNLMVRAGQTTNQLKLSYAGKQNAEHFLFSTTNLASWSSESLGIEGNPPSTNVFRPISGTNNEFFRLTQVQYPSSTLAPKSFQGKRLVETFSSAEVITNAFDMQGAGTYAYRYGTNILTGTIDGYTWAQAPYDYGTITLEYSGLVPMRLRLAFSSSTAGSFSGTAYTFPLSTSISGTFKLQ